MNKTALHWLGRSLVAVAAAALLTGCAGDAPVGPDRPLALQAPHAAAAAAQVGAAAGGASSDNRNRVANLGACQSLRVPAASKLAFHVYARGVQIYHWTGAGWAFDGPEAELFADARGRGKVGTHYSGPIWESVSGGKVAGALLQKCTPDSDHIPWLLLGATPDGGPGIFHRVTHIHRVNTVGGNAPSNPGSFTGEMARVPYTAEYFFYRASN